VGGAISLIMLECLDVTKFILVNAFVSRG